MSPRIADAEDNEDWQSSTDIELRRFAEHQPLEAASGRRKAIERAKDTPMELHAIADDATFELLREQSRIANRKLIDLADTRGRP